MWFYGDAGGQRKGPVSQEVLERLLVRGIVPAAAPAWRDGMPQWAPLQDTPELGPLARLAAAQWFHGSQSSGGCSLWGLVTLFRDGAVDGMTPVWSAALAGWTPLGEVEGLRGVLSAAASAAAEGSGSAAEGSAAAEGEGSAAEGSAAEGEDEAKKEQEQQQQQKRKRPREHGWVYFSGLPGDATAEEVAAHFSKCGLLARDAGGDPVVKLYRDDGGALKGDGMVQYAVPEAVPLALEVLDDGALRYNVRLAVSRATFGAEAKKASGSAESGAGAAARKRRKKKNGPKLSREAVERQKKLQRMQTEQMLSWDEGDEDVDGLKIVIVKHAFAPADFADEAFERELEADLAGEAEKLGALARMTVFSRHRDGVVELKFEAPAAAAECVRLWHGRAFGGRRLAVTFWDGVVDYANEAEAIVAATGGVTKEEEEEERLEAFGDWLDDQELDADLAPMVAPE